MSVFGNSSTYGSAFYKRGESTINVYNTIIWANLKGTNGLGYEGEWETTVKEEGIPEKFPGDPNAKETVFYTNNIIEAGWSDTRSFSSDPLFVDSNDPDGPDNIWFTEDDGLRLRSSRQSTLVTTNP